MELLKYEVRMSGAFGRSGTDVYKFDTNRKPLNGRWQSEEINSLVGFSHWIDERKDAQQLILFADIGNGLPILMEQARLKQVIAELKLTARPAKEGSNLNSSAVFKDALIIASIPVPTDKGVFQICTFKFRDVEL